VRNEVRRLVGESLARLRESAARADAAARGVDAAREALRIVTAAYREGSVLLVELFQARSDFAEAEAARVAALTDARVAAAQLQLTLGQEPGS
jgi:outer membrane protein TolC